MRIIFARIQFKLILIVSENVYHPISMEKTFFPISGSPLRSFKSQPIQSLPLNNFTNPDFDVDLFIEHNIPTIIKNASIDTIFLYIRILSTFIANIYSGKILHGYAVLYLLFYHFCKTFFSFKKINSR